MNLAKAWGGIFNKLAIAIGLIASLSAVAADSNTVIRVRSSLSNSDPYDIVYKGGPGPFTSLEPGVYTPEGDTLKLVHKGNVDDVGRIFTGILSEFPMTKISGGFESFSIVDGTLVLFSNKSRATEPDSVLVFGHNTPLYDSVRGTIVELGPIKSHSPDDINIVIREDNQIHDGELFLVSVKQKNINGSGITFAGALKKNNGKLALMAHPVVIDYNFRAKDDLARLNSSEFKVISQEQIASVTRKQANDDRTLQEYRKFLTDVAKDLGAGNIANVHSKYAAKWAQVPYFDVVTGHLSTKEFPADVIMEKPLRIIQRSDPFQGHSGLFFGNGQVGFFADPEQIPELPGKIEYNPAEQQYKVVNLSVPPDIPSQAVVLASVDGRRQLVFWSLANNKHKAIDVSDYIPADVFTTHHIAAANHVVKIQTGFENYVVLSLQKADGKSITLSLKIIDSVNAVKIDEVIPLIDRYLAQGELVRRLQSTVSNGVETVLFDNVTQEFLKEEPVLPDRDFGISKTVPFVNLTDSTANDIKQIYLESVRNINFQASELVWRYYNPIGAKENKTGLYQDLPTKFQSLKDPTLRSFVQGRLLSKEDLDPKMKTVQDQINRYLTHFKLLETDQAFIIEQQGKTGRGISAHTVPILPHEMEGKEQFQLALRAGQGGAFVPTEQARHPIFPILQTINLPFSFARYEGVQIVQGRRKYSNEFIALIFASGVEDQKDPSFGGPGMYAVPLRIDRVPGNDFDRLAVKVRADKARWIHSGHLNSQNVRDRIIFDADGAPLWMETASLEITDKNFMLLNLVRDFDVLKPNQGMGRVTIHWDERLENKEWGLELAGESPWAVYGENGLMNRFKEYKTHLETMHAEAVAWEKELAAGTKKGKKPVENLFPDMREHMDIVAKAGTANDHVVYLVSDELYEPVRNQMFDLLMDNNNRTSNWYFWNNSLDLFVYDPAFNPEETLSNLARIGRGTSRKPILYVDMKNVLEKEESENPESMVPHVHAVKSVPEALAAETPAAKPTPAKSAEESAQLLMKIVEPPNPSEQQQLTPENENKNAAFPYARLSYVALEGDNVDDLKAFSRPRQANHFGMVALATPEQWRRMKDQFPREKDAGVFNTFKVDARFLTASWTVWSPKSSRASPQTVEFNRTPISKDEYQVFGSLETILQSLLDEKAPAQHRLLVVPEEIKPLINRMIMSRWASDSKEMQGAWNYRNRDLALFSVQPGNVTQESIQDNFESMRGAKNSRHPVLLADLKDIMLIGRPGSSSEDREFKIRDPNSPAGTSLAESSTSDGDTVDHAQVPHMLWWMASEGKDVQPNNAKGWTIASQVKPEIPMLILATEKEIKALDQDAAFESRFLNLKDQFSVVELEKPSEAHKQALLEDLFRRPEISSLNYQFKHNGLDATEARRQLIGLTIGRAEQISRQDKLESTSSFLKIYSALKKALTEDVELRRNREIDASYLSRLFAKVFPQPLSYQILRKDDRLQRLRVPEDAARRMQELGYEGPLELKTRFIRAITSHTRGASDAGRQIPSSIVVIGDGGSGKTFLFETAIDLLGLKKYNFNSPHDEDVEAFVLRVMDLVEKDDPTHPEKLSVDKALAHLDNYLCKPNGWRGMILIDDLHKAATKEILQKLMTRFQSMAEAEGGILKVRCMKAGGLEGDFKEVPVRNIMFGITLNPTNDLDKRKKFFKDFEHQKDPVREAVAALSIGDYSVDASFFSRVGDVIDLSDFPRAAKVPSLINKLREANLQSYSASPRMVLVTPRTLDSLVTEFPNSNARDFLIPATYAILNLPNDMPKAPIYVVDPQAVGVDDKVGSSGKEKVDPGKIEDALRRTTVVHGVYPDQPQSKLKLISFLVDNFRGMIYNSLVLSAQNSQDLSRDYSSRATELMSFLTGILGNLSGQPQIPMDLINIRPQDLGVTELNAITDLQAQIKKDPSNAKMPSIRVPVGDHEERVDLQSFLGVEAPNLPERNRMDLMKQTSHDIQVVLEKLLAGSLHVGSLAELTDPVKWLAALDESEPKAAFKASSEQLIKIFMKFSAELYDSALKEMQDRDKIPRMQLYDEMRLFLLCLDSAVAQIRWSYVSEFLIRAASSASNDLSLGQRAGVQHFLFKSTFSPFTTTTPDSVVTSARGVSVMKNVTDERLEKYAKDFGDNCEKYLSGKVEEEP